MRRKAAASATRRRVVGTGSRSMSETTVPLIGRDRAVARRNGPEASNRRPGLRGRPDERPPARRRAGRARTCTGLELARRIGETEDRCVISRRSSAFAAVVAPSGTGRWSREPDEPRIAGGLIDDHPIGDESASPNVVRRAGAGRFFAAETAVVHAKARAAKPARMAEPGKRESLIW